VCVCVEIERVRNIRDDRVVIMSASVNFPVIFGCMLLVNVGLSVASSEWYKEQQKKQQQSSPLSPKEGDKPSSVTQSSPEDVESKKRWLVILRKYLIVYLLATMADWLQGPYVYALYAEYKYVKHDIAVLFVAGFGSSMIFGSFVGGMADWGGRRAFVVLFAIIYAASCMTKRTYVCMQR
jgi:Sugar-tranasporters, 12 TM